VATIGEPEACPLVGMRWCNSTRAADKELAGHAEMEVEGKPRHLHPQELAPARNSFDGSTVESNEALHAALGTLNSARVKDGDAGKSLAEKEPLKPFPDRLNLR